MGNKDEDKRWCIYCHTNKINNKKYIGQTCQKPEKRWAKGNGYKNNKHFYKSIQKYGWDNFEHEVLFENLKHEKANQIEITLIHILKTQNPEFGYNIAKGGSDSCQVQDLTGQKFGKLTVLYRDISGKYNGTRWICKCDCGNFHSANGAELKRGNVSRCSECTNKLYHIYNMTNTKLYKIWNATKFKSQNNKMDMCDEWKYDFMNFYNWAITHGYKEGLFLYSSDFIRSPETCSWVTCEEFRKYTAPTYTSNGITKTLKDWSYYTCIPITTLKNRIAQTDDFNKVLDNSYWDHTTKYTYNNQTLTAKQWSELTGLKVNTIRGRIERGWSIEKTLTTPLQHNKEA